MMHIVEKQSAHLCISKQMVKMCLSEPLSIKQKSVEFACVPRPSVLARSLEKRALSGGVLFQEISQLPTVFRKVEFEPVTCKSEMSSMTLLSAQRNNTHLRKIDIIQLVLKNENSKFGII